MEEWVVEFAHLFRELLKVDTDRWGASLGWCLVSKSEFHMRVVWVGAFLYACNAAHGVLGTCIEVSHPTASSTVP